MTSQVLPSANPMKQMKYIKESGAITNWSVRTILKIVVKSRRALGSVRVVGEAAEWDFRSSRGPVEMVELISISSIGLGGFSLKILGSADL